MPGVSVIVPVYGVADYLPGCLDSILSSDGDDLEVIAVDDGSPDRCARILEDHAAQDDRLHVVRLDHNHGQGHARNLALGMAAGDYVWFVDSDDMAAIGALPAIRAALDSSLPDMLLIDWVNWYPGGRTEPNPDSGVLSTVPDAGCTLEQQPKLIDHTMTSWSKVFRRDFLRGLDVGFADGIHEDIVVTCAALLEAKVIGATDHVCYRYRRARKGAAMATTSHGQLAVFDSYQRVFEMLAKRAADGSQVSDELYAAIFQRAIWHYTNVLQSTGPGVGRVGLPGLVPRADRKQFFERMHEDFVRYRPPSYEHPPGARGAKFRLIERGAYRTYSLLEPLTQLRAAAGRLIGRG